VGKAEQGKRGRRGRDGETFSRVQGRIEAPDMAQPQAVMGE